MSRKTSKVIGGQTGTVNQYNFLRDEARGASWLLASGTSTLKVQINPSIVYFGNDKVEFAGGYTPVLSNTTASSRIDVVSINSAGTIIVTEGVEADTPSAPDIPAGNMPICEVYNKHDQTEITDEDEGVGKGYINKDLRTFLQYGSLYDNIGVRAYKDSSTQYIDNQERKIWFDAEDFDEGGDFDNILNVGQADATQLNKLHDADGGFTADMVGMTVYNLTDKTYTTITAFVDSGELTLASDMFISGECYVIYSSRFTAPKAGRYNIIASLYFGSGVDQEYRSIYIFKNGNVINQKTIRCSGTGALMIQISAMPKLALNDYIEIFGSVGTPYKIVEAASQGTYLEIATIS